METVVAIIAIVLGIVGIIGSIVPGLPGPPVSWFGMLALYIWGGGTHAGHPMTLTLLLVWLAITVIITILDYIVPSYFTKVTGGSKYGGIGAAIGLIGGMIFTPIGMILGALLGAFIAEFIFAQKDAGSSAKSALGAFLGFMCGMGMKFIASAIMMYDIVLYAF